jgi:hypothetical protein
MAPGFLGWRNLSCLPPPTLVQPSRLSLATILRVLVSGAAIDRRVMRQYRRTNKADSISMWRGAQFFALKQLLAPDRRDPAGAVTLRAKPSTASGPAGNTAAALANWALIVSGFYATWHTPRI